MRRGTAPLALTLLFSATACVEPRDAVEGADPSCTGCHGSAEEDPGPPPGVWLKGGLTTTRDRGVGAHRRHLHPPQTGALASAVTCLACHKVPLAVDDPGHMDTDLPAEVVFTGLARTDGASPSWNGATCARTYCHGSTLSGGSATAPRWTLVDGSQARCSSCHGNPPGGTHPQSGRCADCHPKVVDAQGRIAAPSLHVNGKVEATTPTLCSDCHGSSKNSAPPVDVSGNSSTTARGVGAHQAHVVAGARRAALDCDACHLEPKAVGDPGHTDTALPAEVTFGALARANGLKPAWSPSTLRCATTYCHGLDGAGNPAPAWTQGEKMACGSCHGLPPVKTSSGGSHPGASLGQCVNCHVAVVDGSGQIVAPDRHINGKVDYN